jgi:proline-specific peptidase
MTTPQPTVDGLLPFRGHRLRYRVWGDLAAPAPGRLPLLALHGRPVSSDALEPLAALAASGRPVVLYDQLGHGRSDRPRDPGLWSLDLHVEEVGEVRRALGLDRVHLLGHSFGGVFALEYALERPAGVASLVLHAAAATFVDSGEANAAVRATLPPEVREALERHEAAGTTDDPEYRAAGEAFAARHVCRVDPWPEFLTRALEGGNAEANGALWGRDQRHAPGGMGSWDVRGLLGGIRVPTLVMTGRFDGLVAGAGPALAGGIPGAEAVEFAASSHYAHAEEPGRFVAVLEDFLRRAEAPAA